MFLRYKDAPAADVERQLINRIDELIEEGDPNKDELVKLRQENYVLWQELKNAEALEERNRSLEEENFLLKENSVATRSEGSKNPRDLLALLELAGGNRLLSLLVRLVTRYLGAVRSSADVSGIFSFQEYARTESESTMSAATLADRRKFSYRGKTLLMDSHLKIGGHSLQAAGGEGGASARSLDRTRFAHDGRAHPQPLDEDLCSSASRCRRFTRRSHMHVACHAENGGTIRTVRRRSLGKKAPSDRFGLLRRPGLCPLFDYELLERGAWRVASIFQADFQDLPRDVPVPLDSAARLTLGFEACLAALPVKTPEDVAAFRKTVQQAFVFLAQFAAMEAVTKEAARSTLRILHASECLSRRNPRIQNAKTELLDLMTDEEAAWADPNAHEES